MICSSITRIVSISTAIAIFVTATAAWPHKQGQKANVRFLATGTIVRFTGAWNEDTYLAELQFAVGDEWILARLIDSYPNEAPPLSRGVLTSSSGTGIKVRRDTECDSPYGQMILRTAPGDPLAILPERLGYQPQRQKPPEADAILPCYRTVR